MENFNMAQNSWDQHPNSLWVIAQSYDVDDSYKCIYEYIIVIFLF